jgi:hypothetical protein
MTSKIRLISDREVTQAQGSVWSRPFSLIKHTLDDARYTVAFMRCSEHLLYTCSERFS